MEYLFDEMETSLIRYVCLATEENRYDFSLVYSELFHGKSVVTCLQSGKSMLMSYDDIDHEDHWVRKLDVAEQDVEAIRNFFTVALPSFAPAVSQY